jgi:hypothetical protein
MTSHWSTTSFLKADAYADAARHDYNLLVIKDEPKST